MQKWRKERNRALKQLDMEWARKAMPTATSDDVRLMAMHKARYECTDMDDADRLISSGWLYMHGCKRMDGTPLLPAGELPR